MIACPFPRLRPLESSCPGRCARSPRTPFRTFQHIPRVLSVMASHHYGRIHTVPTLAHYRPPGTIPNHRDAPNPPRKGLRLCLSCMRGTGRNHSATRTANATATVHWACLASGRETRIRSVWDSHPGTAATDLAWLRRFAKCVPRSCTLPSAQSSPSYHKVSSRFSSSLHTPPWTSCPTAGGPNATRLKGRGDP